VIEGRRHPAVGGVAVVAGVATRDMTGMLAGRHGAVMAGGAGADHLCVINGVGRSPLHPVMTVGADVGRIDVRRRFARRIHAVVATEAVTGDVYMVEIGGHPGDRGVAVVAGVAALDMCRILAHSDRAVVAGTARADDLRVIHDVSRRPDHIVMTILADIARVDVTGTFAGRLDAVMAAGTIIGNVGMVEVGRYPRVGGVAIVAGVAAADVRRVFAGGYGAIVARTAQADDLRVVDGVSRDPLDIVVTAAANVGRRNVRRVFAGSADAVVAVYAVTDYVGVIEVGGNPDVRRMAVLAIIAASYMRRILASGIYAVMAAGAIVENVRVIKRCGDPCGRRVAIVTGVSALDMRRVLARRSSAVVTGAAGAQDLRVVDGVCRRPCHVVMAVFTQVRRIQVGQRVLAGCADAVVAAGAVVGGTGMVEISR